MITLAIFGMTISELITVIGILITIIGSIVGLMVYIRTKLIEFGLEQQSLKIKMLEMEERITKNEKKLDDATIEIKEEPCEILNVTVQDMEYEVLFIIKTDKMIHYKYYGKS